MNNVTKLPRPKISLANVSSGKIARPLRVLGFGVEGVGKSTFAAGAPKPIFIGAEDGTANLDISRFEPETFDDALEFLDALSKEEHSFKTVVIDPINWLEPLVWAKVAGPGKSIEEVGGGFGKGYTAAVDQWRILVSALERLWHQGMHVIILAHCQVKAFNDPEGPSYDRYELAMNVKAAGLFKQWVDYVLFMRREAFSKVDEKSKRVKGFSTGARVIHTQWSAAYDAKQRVKLPDELPLSWDEFATAVECGNGKADAARAEIERLIELIGDAEVTKKARGFVAGAGDDAGKLAEIANALAVKADAKEQTK